MKNQQEFADEQGSQECVDVKRAFVEPQITAPENVLEATTFFQGVTSGLTRPTEE